MSDLPDSLGGVQARCEIWKSARGSVDRFIIRSLGDLPLQRRKKTLLSAEVSGVPLYFA